MSNTNSKIISSEYKNIIDSELMKGTSYRTLSENLKNDYGFDVSHSALSAYHKKYLGGKVDKEEIEQIEPNEEESNFEEIEYNPNAPNRDVLKRMFQRQLQIVDNLQDKYMKGKRKFPEQELKALKIFDELLKSNHIDRELPSEKTVNSGFPEWNG